VKFESHTGRDAVMIGKTQLDQTPITWLKMDDKISIDLIGLKEFNFKNPQEC
jgi:hypothetical protein